jgi:DNA-directed RNA polymerase subunit K/omega
MSTSKSKKNNKINVVTKPKNTEKENKFMKRASGEATKSLSKLEQNKGYQSEDDEEEDEEFELKRENKEDDEEVEEEEKEKEDQEEQDDDYDKKDKEKEERYDEDECMYNYANNKNDEDSEDEEDIGLTEEEDTKVENELRITKPVLTKYERVRALGARSKQLSMGAKPMIKNASGLSAREIANLELMNKIMPYIIERQLPNGRIEKWNINDLKIVN